jgi:hypothetical protein
MLVVLYEYITMHGPMNIKDMKDVEKIFTNSGCLRNEGLNTKSRFLHTYPPTKTEQIVPKRRHIFTLLKPTHAPTSKHSFTFTLKH